MEFVGRRELSIYQVFGPALFSRTGSAGRQAPAKDCNNLMAGYLGLFQHFQANYNKYIVNLSNLFNIFFDKPYSIHH